MLFEKQLFLFVTLLFVACSAGRLQAQDIPQPPVNYGLTSAMDGAAPGPGIYLMEYIQTYHATFMDGNGGEIAPNGKIPLRLHANLLMNQVAWITEKTLLGGNLEFTALIPLVHLKTAYPYNLVGMSGLGDPVVGVGIQWLNSKLFGMPFLHRFELDVSLPVGFYDDKGGRTPINASSGFLTVEPYWSQTLMFSPKTSVSFRHHLTYNRPFTKIPDLSYQVGMMYHVNFSLEQVIAGKFEMDESGEGRLGIQGYYGRQFTDDMVNGVPNPAGGESVFAIGPLFHWLTMYGVVFEFKAAYEFQAVNRPQGIRTTFRFIRMLNNK